MSFKLIADTFSVARDSDHFIQLKTLKKPKTDDQVWMAIEIVGDSKYARSTAQSIIDTMEEVFFDDMEQPAYDRFEQALKEVNIITKNLKGKRKKNFGEVNAIIAIFSGNELHLTQSNTAEAYLIRKNKFSMISEGLDGRATDDLFVNIASGEIASDDKLIFATARLLRLATHSQLVQLFNDGVAEAVEAIREHAMGNEGLSIGVVCIHSKLMAAGLSPKSSGKLAPVLNKLKGVFGAAGSFVSERAGTVSGGKSRKNVLIALLAVIILLVVSVFILMDSRRNKAIREEYRIQIENLTQDIQAANTRGYSNDKETANAILEKVEGDTRKILETNFFRAEALALLDKIQETRDSINNTDRVKGVAPYADLAAKRENIKAQGLVSLDEKLFVHEHNTLFEVILDNVLDPRTIDESEVVISASPLADQDLIVFLTKSGRIIEFAEGIFRFINTEDQAWKSGVDVYGYGKNIYILSPQDNQIYKYSRLRSSYSRGAAYNSDAPIEDGLALAIDGNIYVLKEGGEIVKIFKSEQAPFRIENLPVDLSTVTDIYTAAELDNIYLLDPTNKRVVIITKDSQGISRYYGQVVFEDVETLKGFYVEPNENKLHVVTDKELYSVDI